MTSHAEAVVETIRATRYLDQICSHIDRLAQMSGHRSPAHGDGVTPPQVQQVEWNESGGTIIFVGGVCTLRAEARALRLAMDADDDDTLERIKDLVGHRLETIGRRDDLKVTWPPDSSRH